MPEQLRRFPILRPYGYREDREWSRRSWPVSVPWSLLEPHRLQAEKNHGQSIERLAERGGLSPQEMWCVLNDFDLGRWKEVTLEAAMEFIMRAGGLLNAGVIG